MIKKAIEDFRAQLNQSPELQTRARDLDVQGLVALAQEKGFEIDPQALNEFLGAIQNEQLELSDFELEIVAGGGEYSAGSSECNCV